MSFHVSAGSGESLWVGDDTYTVKTTGVLTDGALGLLEASVPPGYGPPPHVHSAEDETFYVLAGVLELTVGDQTHTARPGDLVFLPRGTPHSFTNPGVEAARALIIVTPGGFEAYFQEIGVPARPGATAPGMSGDDMRHAVEAAARYGVRVLAPPDAPPDGPGDAAPDGRPGRPDEPRGPAVGQDEPAAGQSASADDFARGLFALIDTTDVGKIMELMADDARLVFGNGEPLVGRDALTAGLRGFFATIDGLHHTITRQWTVQGHTVAETEVTYRRLDQRCVTVPAVSIWHRRHDGLIDDYRVYVDLAPVYGPTAAAPRT